MTRRKRLWLDGAPLGTRRLAKSLLSRIPAWNVPSERLSSASCDNFQVLCLNDCQLVARPIMSGPQCFEFFAELSSISFIQRYERAIGGPIVLTKEPDHFSGREGVGKV